MRQQHGLAIESPSMSDGLGQCGCDRWTDQKGTQSRRINKSTYSDPRFWVASLVLFGGAAVAFAASQNRSGKSTPCPVSVWFTTSDRTCLKSARGITRTLRCREPATFANKRSEVIGYAIDGMFRKLLDEALDPRPIVPMGFILRAHPAIPVGGRGGHGWAGIRGPGATGSLRPLHR